MSYPGAHAAARPDHPAVVMAGSGETVTYRQIDERSIQLARLWHERGLRPGDHIAIVLANHVRYLEVVWAALRSGLYYTPVNWHLTAPEVAYIVGDCGARSVVTSADLADRVADLAPEIPLVLDGDLPGWERYEDVVGAQPTEPRPEQPEGAAMPYSSGTTGRPKGILFPLPERTVLDEHPIVRNAGPLGNGPDDVYLSPAPMYHTAPVVFSSNALRVGATVVVLERWDPEACLAAIERHRVTTTQMVPTMFVRLMKLPAEVRDRYDISSLRLVVHAAAPCPVEVKRQVIEWLGPIVWEYYAGSENAGSTLIGPEDWLSHPGSVGRAMLSTIHICDPDGRELPVGEIGDVWFDSPLSNFVYHGDAAKTAGSRSPEGWLTLGDVGYVDGEGYLYLTDRRSFTIISGGVNIYPQAVEDTLVAHPAVADAAVFGVPNDDLGEEVKAVVELLDPAQAGPAMADELMAWCRGRLAAYTCPRSVDFEDALPRSDTGKLYKRLLKDRYWGDRTSRIV